MTTPFDLTPADIACITEAFEAIAGSVTGDLVPDAAQITARDPKWSAQARSLLERLDAARSEGDGPDWSTSSLRNMIARAAQTPQA
jgi:hypothetical protein